MRQSAFAKSKDDKDRKVAVECYPRRNFPDKPSIAIWDGCSKDHLGREHWTFLPKTQISYEESDTLNKNTVMVVEMPFWLADDRGLNYEEID